MKHYLFEITEGEYEGELFIAGADTGREADDIACNVAGWGNFRFIRMMDDWEAEASGLDEY